MISFFRKIRQNLLAQNRFTRYLVYALGEILLVVIGILIALQVNNWNQNRLRRAQEVDSLFNLKSELQKNRIDLEKLDSAYARFESSTEKGIELLNSGFFVNDLIALDTLVKTLYTTFPLTKSTYEEMLNTGNYYNIKNEKLKTKINELYLGGERRTSAFSEINRNTQEIFLNTALFSYYYIIDRLEEPTPDLNGIDTLWIHDVNSPGFQTLYNRARIYQNLSNKIRRKLLAEHMLKSGELIVAIDEYLDTRTP